MRRITFICLLLILAFSTIASAQETGTQTISWGTLKANFNGTTQNVSSDKVWYPNPWPFTYRVHWSISDTSAKDAMMKVGLQTLSTCSDVAVMSSTTTVADGEVVAISATRPDGKSGVWMVDLLDRTVTQEWIFGSLDVDSLSVLNVTSGQEITSSIIDDAAEEESAQDHLDAYAEVYDPEAVGTYGIWGDIKSKWNMMNTCEQVMLVSGIVTCSTVGGLYAVGCGAGFFLSASAFC